MAPVNKDLLARVVRVLDCRRKAKESAGTWKRINDEVKTEHAVLISKVAIDKAALAAEETAIEAVVLTHFATTSDKKPVPGVEVKEFDVMEYAAEDALAWAREKKMALTPESLNVTAFEAFASADPASFPFVKFKKEPRMQIATDLGKALTIARATDQSVDEALTAIAMSVAEAAAPEPAAIQTSIAAVEEGLPWDRT